MNKVRPGIRLRLKPPKRRSPSQRLKSRLYYRRNKAKIRAQRRRYIHQHKTTLKNRKLFKRFKPTWMKKSPTLHHPKINWKVKAPKHVRPKGLGVFHPRKPATVKVHRPKIF